MTHPRTARPAPDAAAPPTDGTPDEHRTASAIAGRPELLDAYRRELPGARAAVLARLWGAFAREPLPFVAGWAGGTLTCRDGRTLTGPAALAEPFAVPPAGGFTLTLAGRGYDHPARLVAALGLAGTLTAELDNSVANLALARAAARHRSGERSGEPAGQQTPADHEQSVVDGHPLHPCCRTRAGMSTDDVLRYAPEHHPVVDVVLVDVPPERWYCSGVPRRPRLPVHPWQLQRALEAGLRPTGASIAARPLMSLRTLAPAGGGPHLKTAVDVQMTSAVRTVSPAAVRNGPVVSALLAELARRTADLGVLREVSAAAVLVDGLPARSLAAVWREPAEREPSAPRPTGDGRDTLPFAALANRPAFVREHFDALARLVMAPTLTLLQLGVALEAHGQNLLLVTRAGRPWRVLYRDIGGVRVSPRRLALAGLQAPELHGDLAEDDPEALRTKLYASALSTVLGELVAVLVRGGDDADRLWDRVAVAARRVFAALPAQARADEKALFGAPWPVKAMTAMRLSGAPLDEVWASLPNPLAGRRPVASR